MRTLHKSFFGLFVLSTLAAVTMISSANSAQPSYNAICDGRHGLTVGWIGPDRFNYGEALTDARVHRLHFPDHNVDVLGHD